MIGCAYGVGDRVSCVGVRVYENHLKKVREREREREKERER